MAYIIKTDGTVIPTEPQDTAHGFTLEEMYTIVRGPDNGEEDTTIEIVPAKDKDWILVINEDGKFLDLPRNGIATQLAYFATPWEIAVWMTKLRQQGIDVINVSPFPPDFQDYIAGDCLFCLSKEVK